MKIKLVIPFIAIMLVILSACASSSSSITDGSKKMKETLVELKKSVDAGDASKVKKGYEDLEASWGKFEDDVKKKDSALYGKVEDPLHVIKAGGEADKIDAAALNKSITDLNSALDQVQNLK